MKILVDASLIKYAKVFAHAGFTVGLYFPNNSAFDTFDSFQPDVFIGDIGNISNSLVKIIKEKPALRFGFFHLNNISPNFVVLKQEGIYPQFILSNLIADEFEGIKTYANDDVADLVTFYKGVPKPEFKADAVVVEQFLNIDLPLIPPEFVFRIFSSNLVHHINYCGNVQEGNIKHIYASSEVVLCSPENALNCIVAGGYPISLNSTEDDIVAAIEKDHTTEKIELFNRALQRNIFNVCADMMNYFGLEQESKQIIASLGDLLK